MRILFFDTETNGLPRDYNASYDVRNNWPALLSAAFEVWELSPTCVSEVDVFYSLVRPPQNCVWDAQAETIHHISRPMAENGKSLLEVLDRLEAALVGCTLFVAHNISFDVAVLNSASHRLRGRAVAWCGNPYCTMLSTTTLCGLKFPRGGKGLKWPRLNELYHHLHHEDATDLHCAANDVRCLVRCYFTLALKGFDGIPTTIPHAGPCDCAPSYQEHCAFVAALRPERIDEFFCVKRETN